MHREFRELLEKATGASELVVAVNVDIRGFSSFSKTVDSLQAALFIKRVYMKLIDEYFSNRSFFKPTGDGLLIIIPYNEENLEDVLNKTIISCLNVVVNFSSFCSSDPLINFNVPGKVGIGLSRGSACRLFSEDKTLDYSGSVLNIASRLMDLARPSGIVFDANLGIELLQDEVIKKFEEDDAFIKGISEGEPIDIYRTENIRIPPLNKQPIGDIKWEVEKYTQKLKQIKDFGPWFAYKLPSKPINRDQIKVKISHPGVIRGRKRTEIALSFDFDNFVYYLEAGKPNVRISFDSLAKRLEEQKVKDNWDVDIEIIYPKE